MNSTNAPIAGGLGKFALEISSFACFYCSFSLFCPKMGLGTDLYALSPTGC
jgi:hypothetical protein